MIVTLQAVCCDGCSQTGFASSTANTARHRARQVGWIVATEAGLNLDLCPACEGSQRRRELVSRAIAGAADRAREELKTDMERLELGG